MGGHVEVSFLSWDKALRSIRHSGRQNKCEEERVEEIGDLRNVNQVDDQVDNQVDNQLDNQVDNANLHGM